MKSDRHPKKRFDVMLFDGCCGWSCCAKSNSTMSPITKRFVLRGPTSAKRDSCIFSNQLAAGPRDAYSTSNMQWAIRSCVDRGFLLLWFLWTAIKSFEVQCAGWAGHDYFGDFIRGGGIYQNPWSILRLKDFRQAPKAITGVIANLRFPIDNDFTQAAAILSLHAWALAFFIFGR